MCAWTHEGRSRLTRSTWSTSRWSTKAWLPGHCSTQQLQPHSRRSAHSARAHLTHTSLAAAGLLEQEARLSTASLPLSLAFREASCARLGEQSGHSCCKAGCLVP